MLGTLRHRLEGRGATALLLGGLLLFACLQVELAAHEASHLHGEEEGENCAVCLLADSHESAAVDACTSVDFIDAGSLHNADYKGVFLENRYTPNGIRAPPFKTH